MIAGWTEEQQEAIKKIIEIAEEGNLTFVPIEEYNGRIYVPDKTPKDFMLTINEYDGIIIEPKAEN